MYRFVSDDRWVPEPNTGCWLWLLSLNSSGYGQHRLYYEHYRGKIPKGMTIDHLCGTPACVNPDHMEVVTYSENNRRKAGPYQHGTRRMYDGQRCRCDKCRAFNTARHRAYIERRL